MLNNDFGWIVDENHPVKLKFNKEAIKDVVIGLGITLLGIGYTVVTTFFNGGLAYQEEEYRILYETGKITPIGDGENAEVGGHTEYIEIESIEPEDK